MAKDSLGRLPEIMLTVVILFSILYVGTYALNEAQAADQTGGRVSQAALLDGTNSVTIADTVGKKETVVNSRGYAINLTGSSDSYFQTEQNIDIASDKTWTVSFWARADSDAGNKTMTAVSVDGRLVVNYNGTSGNWTAWYFDEGSTSSWNANVSAPDQPSNLTNLILVRNETHLTIYRNNTAGESVNVTGSNIAAAPQNTSNWDGRIDELRTDDDPYNATQRGQVYSNPVAPIKQTNRTSRIMFDQPGKATQLLFFAPGGVTTSNVTYSQGLPGETMDGKSIYNDVTGSTDYTWDIVGPTIRPVSGGQLDGAPVAYVDYTRESQLDSLSDDWNSAMGLAAVLILLLPLGAIITYLAAMRNGR